MDEDEEDEVDEHKKVDAPGDLTVDPTPAQPEPGGDRRRLQQTCDERQRRRDENRGEVSEDLHPVVLSPPLIRREIQRKILQPSRNRVGEDIPVSRHQSLPLPRGEQQHVEHSAGDQPEQVETEMPPTRQTYRMSYPR